MSPRIRSDPGAISRQPEISAVALYRLVGFITLRLTGVIRSYTLQFPGYNPSYTRKLTPNPRRGKRKREIERVDGR